MSKYRIIKLGDTNTYKVQKKIWFFFWIDKMGAIFPITSLVEAREYVELFENGDKYRESLKSCKNTVVE